MGKERDDAAPVNGAASPRTVLHMLAVVEACKGILVLVVGLGLLTLIHHNVEDQAEDLVRFFHMNPARHIPRVFIETAAHMSDPRLWLLSVAAFGYAAIRGVEAFGLWFDKAWAEWFAAVSGGFFVPIEIYEIFRKPTPLRGIVLAFNIAIVVYLISVVVRRIRQRRHIRHRAMDSGTR